MSFTLSCKSVPTGDRVANEIRYCSAISRSSPQMRKAEFVQGLEQIMVGLKAQELVGRIEPLLNLKINRQIGAEEKSSFAALIFESQTNFQTFLHDADTSAILDSLNLPRLYSPENLGKLITLY